MQPHIVLDVRVRIPALPVTGKEGTGKQRAGDGHDGVDADGEHDEQDSRDVQSSGSRWRFLEFER